MNRSKRLILLSHCLLNVNSKVEGLSNYQGALEELVLPLIKSGFGILQLPCPELSHGGINRWGQVKSQYNTPFFRKHCNQLLNLLLIQLLEYQKCDYKICGFIGVDGSPNCGVNFTCEGKWGGEIDKNFCLKKSLGSLEEVEEKGVFVEEFLTLLDIYDFNIPLFAINEKSPKTSIKSILKELL